MDEDHRHPLDAIFKPKTIAVIGATERADSVGHTLMLNLSQNSLGQKIFPVNLKRKTVLGLPTYRRIKDIAEPIDLAVIVTPARTVPGLIKECIQAGVKGAIIISAGFRELGASGAKLEARVFAEAKKGQLRVIGPNCLGVMNPLTGLNATFAKGMAQPGKVAFISQSGAFGNAILDWSLQDRVGFSAFVSVGSMMDVSWGDLITYWGRDYRTRSIVIYMESVGEARSFLSAVREVAFNKPIIILKGGRSKAAASAAATHTGVLARRDEVLNAAFQRGGVVRVDTIEGLFSMADVLAKQPRPRGPRLTIVSNAGGPGIVATDALLSDQGQLAELSPPTLKALNKLLPKHWSHTNPIDILGEADPERFAQVLEIALQEPDSNGTLVILTPQDKTDPTQTAEVLKQIPQSRTKPLIASWMGGAEVAAGITILNRANIPTFPYPDVAAKVFSYMWQYTANLRNLYETPTLPPDAHKTTPDQQRGRDIIDAAQQGQRTLLSELESKQLLAAYNIPTVETRLANSQEEAVTLAEQIGYPVVLKLHSETITHKRAVGGVQLDLADEAAVRRAFQTIQENVDASDFLGVTVQPMLTQEGVELIVGSSIDPDFGPILLFGLGGRLVEVFKDQAVGLPPLTSTLARRLMEQTTIFTALQAELDPPDIAALEQHLVRFSQLVVEHPWIQEIDLNPLLASPGSLIALDVRVLLHPPETKAADLPRPAIRPYPIQYITPWQLKDGSPVTLRPIRAEDEPLIVHLHETLSDHSVYTRFFRSLPLSRRIAHERLSRICFVDYDQELALVVEYKNSESGQHEILGVGRIIKLLGTNEAEFSVLVSDLWQGQGIGSKLLGVLIEVGRQEGVSRIIGSILPENYGMQQVCRKLGFTLNHIVEDRVIMASIDV